MRFLVIASLLTLITTTVIASSASEDVIYKQDGSIIRGNLIEQDFAKGLYKIQIMGGSIFVIPRDEIVKITKEPSKATPAQPSNSITQKSLPATSNKQELAKQPSSQRATQPSKARHSPTYVKRFWQYITTRPNHHNQYPNHVVHLGYGSRTYDVKNSDYTIDDSVEWNLKGATFAYQMYFDKHWSGYIEYADTSMDRITDQDGTPVFISVPKSEYEDIRANTLQALALLSSNNDRGWQFYLGAGFYRDEIQYDDQKHNAVGSAYTLGMGYAWSRLQLHFRIFGHNSDDYEDDIESVSSSTLQLGYQL